MTKIRVSAQDIEQMIRKSIPQTECVIKVGPDPTGWHATVAGWGDSVAHVAHQVSAEEARLKALYDLKPKKSVAELQDMLVEKLRQHGCCKNVTGVAFTRPAGRAWDIATLRDGPHLDVECLSFARRYQSELLAEFDVGDDW